MPGVCTAFIFTEWHPPAFQSDPGPADLASLNSRGSGPHQCSHFVEPDDDIIEINLTVLVEVEYTDGFIAGDPVHLVKVDHYVIEVDDPVAIDILNELIIVEGVRDGRPTQNLLHERDCRRLSGGQHRYAGRSELLDPVVPCVGDVDIAGAVQGDTCGKRELPVPSAGAHISGTISAPFRDESAG